MTLDPFSLPPLIPVTLTPFSCVVALQWVRIPAIAEIVMYTIKFTGEFKLILVMLNTGTHSDLFSKKYKK